MSVPRHSSKKQSDIELGLLQMQILWLLSSKSMHGYALMQRLSEIKKARMTQGTLYPTLQRLEEMKLIRRNAKERRIVYDITSNGRKTMRKSCEDFSRTFMGIFKDFVCEKCR